MPTTSQNSIHSQVAAIQIRTGNDRPKTFRMNDGSSLIVGSDEGCGIQLDDHRVSPKHCMLRMTNGEMLISDWYSESGTLVNGEKIFTEMRIESIDQVQVGPFRLRFAVTSSGNHADPFAELDAAQPDPPDQAHGEASADPSSIRRLLLDLDSSEHAPPAAQENLIDDHAVIGDIGDDHIGGIELETKGSSLHGNPQDLDPMIHAADGELHRQLADAHVQIDHLRNELDAQLHLQGICGSDADGVLDAMQADEIDLLRAEVDQLQGELAQRELELQEALDQGSVPLDDSQNAETAKLVDRLEQLLDELQSSDQRIHHLENLLHVSDEAAQAEREERNQLENWVSEIESRLAEREQQWRAREETLQSRLDEATRRRQDAEKNVMAISQGQDKEFQENASQQITELSAKNEQLHAMLEKYQAEMQSLNRVVDEMGTTQTDLEAAATKLDEIRAHEMEIAQERASLARQRAELVRLHDEVERSAKSVQVPSDNPDTRLREFRQHLKEIHEQEQREKRERSLSSRISRLWQRLDGR